MMVLRTDCEAVRGGEQETWFESADHAVQFQNVKLRCAE